MLFVTFEFTDLSVFIETCNVFKCINRVNIGFNWLFRGMRINICNRPCMLPVYFFGVVYRPTRACSTHMETSPLPVKSCTFWHMLGTHDLWTVRVINRHLLWHGTSVYNGHLRGRVTLTLMSKRLVVDLSLLVFTN